MPTVWAAQAVTVEVVVEQALAHPERVALREATLEAARHEARAARSTGNYPQLTWQEERRGEGAPATTDYLWLTQGLGGLTTGPARRHEARATVAGAAAQADLDDRALVAQVQRAFYLTLWHRERQAQAQAWFARLSLATEATSVRHGAGDASRWELERLQVEVERARAAVSREEAGMVGSWADLAQLTGASPTDAPPLEGPLEPNPPLTNLLVAGAWDAPLAADRQVAESRSARAGRSWLQNANIGGGLISERDPSGGDVGLMLTANIPLPMSAQSRAQAAAFEAEARQLEAKRMLYALHLRGSLIGTSEAMALHLAGASHLREAEEQALALLDMAEAGWTGGELSLVEVLDAHRAAVETSNERLDAQLAARLAWIDITEITEREMP